MFTSVNCDNLPVDRGCLFVLGQHAE